VVPAPPLRWLCTEQELRAELAENAPEAASDADSIGRRGRAVAVTLIAATQRPTRGPLLDLVTAALAMGEHV